MNETQPLHWRKFSPVDREQPIFELVDVDIVILDITRSDGAVEIAFHQGAAGRTFDFDTLRTLLDEGKRLAFEG